MEMKFPDGGFLKNLIVPPVKDKGVDKKDFDI